jgi:hypothetical protein
MTFDPVVFGMEFLLERLSGIGIDTEEWATPNVNTIFEWLKIASSTETELRQQVEDASTRICELERDNLTFGAEIAAMRQSSSWRVTAPIRGLKSRLMRLLPCKAHVVRSEPGTART